MQPRPLLTGRSRPFIFLYCPHALHSVACVSGSRRQLLVRVVPQLAQHLAPPETWLPPAVPVVAAVPCLVVGPLRAGPPLRGALRGTLPLRTGCCCCWMLSAGADTARPLPRPRLPSSAPSDRREADGGRSMLGDSGLLSLRHDGAGHKRTLAGGLGEVWSCAGQQHQRLQHCTGVFRPTALWLHPVAVPSAGGPTTPRHCSPAPEAGVLPPPRRPPRLHLRLVLWLQLAVPHAARRLAGVGQIDVLQACSQQSVQSCKCAVLGWPAELQSSSGPLSWAAFGSLNLNTRLLCSTLFDAHAIAELKLFRHVDSIHSHQAQTPVCMACRAGRVPPPAAQACVQNHHPLFKNAYSTRNPQPRACMSSSPSPSGARSWNATLGLDKLDSRCRMVRLHRVHRIWWSGWGGVGQGLGQVLGQEGRMG